MEIRIKHLDHDALKYINVQRERNLRYPIITQGLSTLGYTTKTGSPLYPCDVSAFACKHGVRSNRYARRKRLSPTAFVPRMPTTTHHTVQAAPMKPRTHSSTGVEAFMHEAIDSQNLTKTQKLKVLTALIED